MRDRTPCQNCEKSYPEHTGIIYHHKHGRVCGDCLRTKQLQEEPREPLKTFYLKRDFTDEVKQRIAEGVIFHDGSGVVMWYQKMNKVPFTSAWEFQKVIEDMPGVELVYAFQTTAPEPPKKDFVKTSITVAVDGRTTQQYIADEVFDAFDKTISSGGSL